MSPLQQMHYGGDLEYNLGLFYFGKETSDGGFVPQPHQKIPALPGIKPGSAACEAVTVEYLLTHSYLYFLN